MYELEELTAPALTRLLDAGVSTAVVPFGSIEHHGGHLPIGADAVLADAVGREVARELDGVLAPTVRVGDAEQHAHLTGTMSLRADTLNECAWLASSTPPSTVVAPPAIFILYTPRLKSPKIRKPARPDVM